MGNAKACSDEDLLSAVREHGKAGAARLLGLNERNVYARLRIMERSGVRVNAPIYDPFKRTHVPYVPADHPQRVHIQIDTGVVIIASDAHYWPGPPSTGHLALIKFIGELSPSAVILNGDVVDCSTISRYPPIGWEKRPAVIDELEAAKERLHEIEMVTSRHCRLVWPLGNHDARFETRLASVAPEFKRVHGVHLRDHFSNRWEPCWSCWINDDIYVSHRYKCGVHHGYNETLHAGLSTVTGDKHALNVTRFSDLRGTRWGVDCGMLADPFGPQFRDYSEDNPRSHEAGFIVLTFIEGRLLWPEVVHVLDKGLVSFRGQIHEVAEAKAAPKVSDGKTPRAKAKGRDRGRTRVHRRGRPSRGRVRAG